MSLWATSRSHVGHQRFCWMRVLHSPCSWLKLSVAPVSVAGNTLIGMFTRLILRYPFHVGRAAIGSYFLMRNVSSTLTANCRNLSYVAHRSIIDLLSGAPGNPRHFSFT